MKNKQNKVFLDVNKKYKIKHDFSDDIGVIVEIFPSISISNVINELWKTEIYEDILEVLK